MEDGVDRDRPPVVALVGPTASGKSALAVEVAVAMAEAGRGVELVSVDSMAVYRGMDIGTATPPPDVRERLPVHLVDLVEPGEEFTVAQFQAAAREVLAAIASRRHAALLVAGTGLYLRAITDDLRFPGRFAGVADSLADEVAAAGPPGSAGELATLEALHLRLAALDPLAASRIEPHNRRRLLRALEVTLGSGRPFSSFGPGLERYPPTDVDLIGVRRSVEELDRRIADRFEGMLGSGLLDEVRRLQSSPGGLSRTARQALGYRELLSHLEAGVPLDEATATAVSRTRAFARRQVAWFRRDPRIVWWEPGRGLAGELSARLAGAPQPATAVGD